MSLLCHDGFIWSVLQEMLRQRGIKDVGLERGEAVEMILAADDGNSTRWVLVASLPLMARSHRHMMVQDEHLIGLSMLTCNVLGCAVFRVGYAARTMHLARC